MRIFIGGVGPAVTAVDVEKTFSSLGRVTGVEFVRKNGRIFAYMDFEPNSEKTLAKLFSTYNGCSWKGGKLKIERAKEHYLERLKREVAEDAKDTPNAAIDSNIEETAGNLKPKHVKPENTELHIFFPKLRKVKSLPFKGTGKHKYSFQRINVPPLPIHFCDCEEHCMPCETASHNYLPLLGAGINYDKELSIMNSVTKKLLRKESDDLPANEETMLDGVNNVPDHFTSGIHVEELEEASETDADEDNLVTNIGTGRRGNVLMQLEGSTPAVGQESGLFCKRQAFKNESFHNKANNKRRQNTKPVDEVELAENWEGHLGLPETIKNEFAGILPQNTSYEVLCKEPQNKPTLCKVHTDTSIVSTQLAKGQSWLQKSSWKNLLGRKETSSFDINNILPSVPPKELKSRDSLTGKSEAKKVKAKIDGKLSKSSPATQYALLEKGPFADEILQKKDGDEVHGGADEHTEPTKACDRESQRIRPADETSHVMKESRLSDELIPSGNDLSCMVNINGTESASSADAPETALDKRACFKLAPRNAENEHVDMPQRSTNSKPHPQEIITDPELGKKQREPRVIVTQSTKGQSWLQKSSWIDLLGGTGSSSFAITDVLPGISSLLSTQPKSADVAIGATPEAKKIQARIDRKISRVSLTGPEPHLKKALEHQMPGNEDNIQEHLVGDEQEEPPNAGQGELLRVRPEVDTSEECTFMRSAESLKQWSQARAALCRRFNKKRKITEDDDSRKATKSVRLRQH